MDHDDGECQPGSQGPTGSQVVLYWIPLGAGATVVRRSGRLFEALCARLEHRPAGSLYHSALSVTVGTHQSTIEMTPVPARGSNDRGVVAGGPVGSAWLGRLRIFRYEIRRWNGGTIPDADAAVTGPVLVTDDGHTARCILELVPEVPTPVWGRDALRAGEMWNSNSVTSWLLARAGVDVSLLEPPDGGRAPGWDAGIVVASRTPT